MNTAPASPSEGVRVGKRVLLRAPRERDRAELLALRARSARRLRPWEPRPPRGATPNDWFDRILAARRDPACRKLVAALVDGGAIVGCASVNNIVRGVAQSASVGYWIGTPYEGRGLMSEAVALLLDHAFRDLRLHRIELNVRPENVRSRRLAEGLGFRREGHSPRYLQIAGTWADHDRFALLSEEWRAARRSVFERLSQRA